MKRALGLTVVLAVVAFFFTVSSVQASSLEEAKALGEQAAAFVKANGPQKGTDEINNPQGQFVKGDMYVTLHNLSGVFVANPVSPGVRGQNHWNLKDPNTGKFFVQEMVEVAKKGSGWVEYNWVNPQTKKVQVKKSWVQRIEGTDLYTLSGIFQ